MNVERTQGGGAVAYLWKYVFKDPSTADVDVHASVPAPISSQEHRQEEHQQSQPQIVDDIQMYRKKRKVGSIEACSRLFQHANVGVHAESNSGQGTLTRTESYNHA